ncbi:MAG: hydroxyisourate hydrolase [Gemmatimonadota bacterium]|nr:hydroxyisourate hydrolase [Gemmatimonadota bacterium]
MSGTGTLSTHVLDTGRGTPATGIPVRLLRGSEAIGAAETDRDGRVRDFGRVADQLAPGSYALVFDVGAYFARDQRATFYREITVAFEIVDGGHFHVPLLLSPFGYSTYRGS